MSHCVRRMLAPGRFTGALLSCALAFEVCAASAADLTYGKAGEPVHLVVGYQPYYTQAWSAMVMRSKEFWKRHLPPGSTVKFEAGLQGVVIVNAMLAGKEHIGYMGDMPAIVATTKHDLADVRIVATLGVAYDQCNIFVARADAPQFNDAKQALQWLNGKQVAVPKGSCTDRFAQAVFKKENIQPGAYLHESIETITGGFRAKKLDAAAVWEPTASRLVEEGLARRIASGASVDENDAGLLAMRADLIKQRPDIVKAWLNAELDAQLFLADPKNAAEVTKMAAAQTKGFSGKVLWMSLYGQYPANQGGTPVRNEFVYTITPEITELIARATEFLHSIKSINVDKLRPDAVMPEFAEAVVKDRGVKSPIGAVKALPMTEFRGKS